MAEYTPEHRNIKPISDQIELIESKIHTAEIYKEKLEKKAATVKEAQDAVDATIEKEYDTIGEEIQVLKEMYDKYRLEGFKNNIGKNKPGATQIGAVTLLVPPSRIAIYERQDNMVIDLMRAPGNIKKSIGKRDITIQIDAIFPDLDSINNILRPLYAQFVRAPFVPIENTHISRIINPQLFWTKDENYSAESYTHPEEGQNLETYTITKNNVHTKPSQMKGGEAPLTKKDRDKIAEDKNTMLVVS